MKTTWPSITSERRLHYRLQVMVSESGELHWLEEPYCLLLSRWRTGQLRRGLHPLRLPGQGLAECFDRAELCGLKTTTGAWRAPISNVYAFAEQSFIAELANSAGVDHRDFLLSALGNKGWIEDGNYRTLNVDRAKATIEAVTKAAGWGRELPEGRGLGLAFFFSHAGHIAEVAEVSVEGKNVRVHDGWVAADIGQVINMSGLENQLQGSVVDGVSTMAKTAHYDRRWCGRAKATLIATHCYACHRVQKCMWRSWIQVTAQRVQESQGYHRWHRPFATLSSMPVVSESERFPISRAGFTVV